MTHRFSRILAPSERMTGVLLVLAVAVALVWANVDRTGSYPQVWHHVLPWTAAFGGTLRTWGGLIDNGLMTVFFLAVGLEVGRERANGPLSDNRHAMLPVAAAVGGMVGAAMAYLLTVGVAGGSAIALGGWGVPMATDVAFTLGAVALLGRRVPRELRTFVLALAVADDVLSVVILAIRSSERFQVWDLMGAVGVLLGVYLLRRRVTRAWWPYVLATCLLWLLLARAGVEPPLAGAFVGMLIPLSPSIRIARVAQPISALIVLPVFALANIGVHIDRHLFMAHETMTVFVALLVARTIGKAVGITLVVALVVKLGTARLPGNVGWFQLLGVASLCGMGFTVPLLFAAAQFAGHPTLLAAARTGLLAGTVVSFALGAVMLSVAARRTTRHGKGGDRVVSRHR